MNGSGTNKRKGFYSIRGRHGPSEDMGLSWRRHGTSETVKDDSTKYEERLQAKMKKA